MKRAILFNFRQGTLWRLVLCLIGIAVILCIAPLDLLVRSFREKEVIINGFHNSVMLAALKSDAMVFFIPIFSVIPLAASYIDDLKSKFVRFFLIRVNYKTYILSRFISCFFSGCIVVTGGILLAWGIFTIIFMPLEDTGNSCDVTANLILNMCALLTLNGGFWAVVGLTLSTLMESKYVAYAAPFILCYIMIIIHDRYVPTCFVMSPKEWMIPCELWPFAMWGPAILLIILSTILCLLFSWRSERRLKEL